MRTDYCDQDGAQGGKKEFSKGCKTEKCHTLSFNWRKEMRTNKPAGRAETAATSIPMKYR